MSLPKTSQKRADRLSLAVMLIGFGVVSYAAAWWPGILLVVGCSLLTRQYLRGREYDMILTTMIFGGLFILFYFDIDWSAVLPVFFVVGGIYLIFREYFVTKERVGEEEMEDKVQEIEDSQDDRK